MGPIGKQMLWLRKSWSMESPPLISSTSMLFYNYITLYHTMYFVINTCQNSDQM
jgi:hypothetical protein